MKKIIAVLILLTVMLPAHSEEFRLYHGDNIPTNLEEMYEKGLRYLVKSQLSDGSWSGGHGGSGPAFTGLAVLAFMAHGEDPNYGPYSSVIKRGVASIIETQDKKTGYMGPSMYHHGFATLALAECYGQIDNPEIGPALEKAVALILMSQSRNRTGAWRYSPESQDADCTISGAQLVALYAARNAGINVPDKAFQTALAFYRSCQDADGGIGYTGQGGYSPNTTAIGTLVFALARDYSSRSFKAAFSALKTGRDPQAGGHMYYFLYYASQAFFQSNMEEWKKWNKEHIERMMSSQQEDGSWRDSNGAPFATATGLLSLALNYRLLPIYER